MEQHPRANVCVAPHSLHAASHDMIRAAAAFARDVQCMLHIHVAEAPYEGRETLRDFGRTPVALLDELGALNERTVAIHAIHLTDADARLLAARRARVVSNPMTNQYLGDGICDVARLRSLNVPMGLGTDADVRPSLIEEMRATALLQKILHLDGAALRASEAFALATAQGARALGIAGGDLVAESPADYVVLDASKIDPWSSPVNAIVYRGQDAWVQATFVGGRRVYVGEPSPLARRAREATGGYCKPSFSLAADGKRKGMSKRTVAIAAITIAALTSCGGGANRAAAAQPQPGARASASVAELRRRVGGLGHRQAQRLTCCPVDPRYGKTKRGHYVCLSEARSEGLHPAAPSRDTATVTRAPPRLSAETGECVQALAFRCRLMVGSACKYLLAILV